MMLGVAVVVLALGPHDAASRRTPGPRSQVITVRAGAAEKRLLVSEPAGVIMLLRVIAPRGTRATLTGSVPGIARVTISTAPSGSADPSHICQRRGTVDVCTQAVEGCPMPAANWRFELRKLAGPAGDIRLEFVVGRSSAQAVVRPVVHPVLGARIHIPAGAVDVVAGDGAVWVAGFGAVSRLDPTTGRIQDTIRTPGTGDYSRVAVGEGGVWITAGGGAVYRIDPASDRVVATIRVGGSVQGIAVGAARVWVSRPSTETGEVIQIDPRTNRVAGRPIEVGPGPGEVTYGQGAAWVQNTSPASVVRIDPATKHVSTIVGVRAVSNRSPVAGAIAVGDGALWSAANGSLARIDTRTGRVVARAPIPRGVAVAIGAGEVWVLAYPQSSSDTVFDPIRHTAALWEVTPRSGRIVGRPIRLDALQPIAVAVTQSDVWIADYDSATVTRARLVASARPPGPASSRAI